MGLGAKRGGPSGHECAVRSWLDTAGAPVQGRAPGVRDTVKGKASEGRVKTEKESVQKAVRWDLLLLLEPQWYNS